MKNITNELIYKGLFRKFKQRLFIAGLIILCCVFLSASADAATFTVNSTVDSTALACSSGTCTLRRAVQEANALAGADAIEFQAGLTGTIDLAFGELVITQSVTITGPGARILTLNGLDANRGFRINGAGVVFNLSGLTIANGRASTAIALGGGIFAQSNTTVNLDSVTVINCKTFGRGGGVALNSTATMTITNSTIRDNEAEGSLFDGGGIFSNGTLSISNSTITGNKADMYAGITNDTLAILTLNNTTVTNNIAGTNRGGLGNDGVANIRNTIIAKNIAPLFPDFQGTVNSLGNNLIGINSGGFVNGVNGDIAGTDMAPVDPLLSPLANNGGPTDTHALIFLSPALNGGQNCVMTATCATNNPPSALTLDQRGTSRQLGPGVDIGAYESSIVPTSASVSVSGRVMAGKRGIAGARVYLTDQGNETRTALTNGFGYYVFDDVPVGETYFFTAAAKGYSFEMRILTVNDEISDLDFIAGPLFPVSRRRI